MQFWESGREISELLPVKALSEIPPSPASSASAMSYVAFRQRGGDLIQQDALGLGRDIWIPNVIVNRTCERLFNCQCTAG